MNLSDRKKKILRIVVDNYINTAQPVSSKMITERYMPDVSSATIRGELYQLEELGFLEQPHTSSGRIPSSDAYKLYVNELMGKGKLTKSELTLIKDKFKTTTDNIEEVVNSTVKIISELTNYTSVGVASHDANDRVLKINIFRYKLKQALLLIVTENTLIRDKFIQIPESMTEDDLKGVEKMINNMFAQKTFKEILSYSTEFSEEFATYKEIFNSVIDIIENYIERDRANVVLEGEEKIMDHQEFSSDLDKIKGFLSIVKSKDKMASLLDGNQKGIDISIKIGNGLGDDIPENCSLISATYELGGYNLGTYGVIGPSRMDYKKVYTVLENVGKVLEKLIDNGDSDE